MISMTKKDYELILEHAKSCVPEEACGLIAGVKNGGDKEIKKVYILTNIDHSNEHFHTCFLAGRRPRILI